MCQTKLYKFVATSNVDTEFIHLQCSPFSSIVKYFFSIGFCVSLKSPLPSKSFYFNACPIYVLAVYFHKELVSTSHIPVYKNLPIIHHVDIQQLDCAFCSFIVKYSFSHFSGSSAYINLQKVKLTKPQIEQYHTDRN